MDVGGHARIAEGAQQDGVEITTQLFETIGSNRSAISQVTVSAPIEISQVESHTHGFDDFYSLGHNLLTDPISGNHRNSFALIHRDTVSQFGASARDENEIIKEAATEHAATRVASL